MLTLKSIHTNHITGEKVSRLEIIEGNIEGTNFLFVQPHSHTTVRCATKGN